MLLNSRDLRVTPSVALALCSFTDIEELRLKEV